VARKTNALAGFFFFVVIKVIATVSMLQAYKKARAVASVIMAQQHKTMK
jgi:hypothetical protein